jgi:ATP-binding protein involved in chromosome partitioning
VSDPRLAVIEKRLSEVGRVVAVSSGKGGVGKSMVATAMALSLARRGSDVGLLDLDFTSPSTHVIMGVEGLIPEEDYGIVPPKAHGLRYMSIVHYSGEEPAPLRGEDVSNAIIELLAITRWGKLDYLVVDMPPGIGDATLDTLRLIPRIEFIVVTTPSKVAYRSVKRLLLLLLDLRIPVIGVLENMVTKRSRYIKEEVTGLGLRYLGGVAHDDDLEAAIGDPDKLLKTKFGRDVDGLARVL